MNGQTDKLTEIWGRIWLNDRLVCAGDAGASAIDRGMLFGDGVYETLRVYAGKPFGLDEHIGRMRQGCDSLRLPCPDAELIRRGVSEVLTANGLTDAYLRITLTRGATGSLWFDLSTASPTLTIIAQRLKPRDHGLGLRLTVSDFRLDGQSPLAGVKHTGILPKILARVRANEAGADDALLYTTDGYVAEGTASNIFWVSGGKLYTPSMDCGILEGITRTVLLSIAEREGLPYEEGRFLPDALAGASEVFLTSSTWELAPVREISGLGSYSPIPGPVTASLAFLYRQAVEEQLVISLQIP